MVSVGLNIGLKALLTSQSALDTIGHNLANANTPGYSRQNLGISTAPGVMIRGLLQGHGVQADVVQRTVDELLNRRLLQQTAVLGRLDARYQGLSTAENLFGSGDSAVDSMVRGLFDSFAALASDPADVTLKTGAVQSATGLAARFNQLSAGLLGLGQDVQAQIEAYVTRVNDLAQEIGELNKQISTVEVGTTSANDLRDRRDQALRDLAQLVDTRVSENERGAVRVLVGNQPLVTPNEALELTLSKGETGGVGSLHLGNSESPVVVTGGAIGGLMSLSQSAVPKISSELHAFAHQFILEVNRTHSTGMGADGPFRQMVGSATITDTDGDDVLDDELLGNSGLPFDVMAGELCVNVSNLATGQLSKYRIAIDPQRTTVAQLLGEINGIDNLSANLDGQGRVRILADAGFGFDFSSRLDANPDEIGSFGGVRASLGTGLQGPFALTSGDTLDVTGASGPFTVTFNALSFALIGQATAEEIAAVINADPGAQANGIVASAVGDDVVMQTLASGTSESFTVTGGTALGALGWTAGTTVTGHATAADAVISGKFTGPENDVYTFRPNMDGSIGITPGLRVDVYNSKGVKLTELDVGDSYRPGSALEVLHGVQVSFGLGQLSASHNDVMRFDVIADADTADLLPALGLNSLFTGSNAATMAVRKDLENDPRQLATSITGAQGDNGALLALLSLNENGIEGLGGHTFEQAFRDITAGVALEVASSSNARDAEQFLMESLEARRDQVAGVNVDEELVHLIEFEQAFSAASQYIRVISDLNQELLNLI